MCSEYSEQKIQAITRPYRAIIHSTWSGSSIRFTFDLFSRTSTQKPFEVSLQGAFSFTSSDSPFLATTGSLELPGQSLSTESTNPLYFEIETLFWPKPESTENTEVLELYVIPNVRSEYSEHYFHDYQSVIPKSTYPIAWSYYNLLPSHWLAIWRIFRRSPLSEEKYPNRNPAWKQALLITDFQGNTRKGSSTSLSEAWYVIGSTK